MAQLPSSRPVFFFDIDNCLYPRSKKVHDLMQELIGDSSLSQEPTTTPIVLTVLQQKDTYFVSYLSLSKADAQMLHQKYYKEYGLAIEGLVRHHKVDPLEYNRKVDDALPLDDIITPDAVLRALLEDIDRTKVKLWLFTNAYITHGKRVIKLLGVDDLFEGITYCDYGQKTMICKPHAEMYEKAEMEADAESVDNCYFVDDSYLNCHHAQARGWTTVHLLDPDDPEPTTPAAKYQIRSLQELRHIFPQFFKTDRDQCRIDGMKL